MDDRDDPVESFLAEVRSELVRARAKFPGDRVMTVALAEEFGELCKAVLDEPAARVRKEAVQTATMAARLVLDGDGSVVEWRKLKGLDPLVPPPAPEQRWTCPDHGLVRCDEDGCCVTCGRDLQPVRLEAKTEEHETIAPPVTDAEIEARGARMGELATGYKGHTPDGRRVT